jgi:peroxiredoxin
MSCRVRTVLIEVLLLQLSGSAKSAPLSQNTNIMGEFFLIAIILTWVVVAVVGWLAWQLPRQNGRILLRLHELEKRFDELDSGEEPEFEVDPSLVTSAATNGDRDPRANRFGNRSLARSRIKRDGLKAGTPAPDFRLSCLDGTERSLQAFRGQRVLLVFSDPQCGPCNYLGPQLEKFHRDNPEITVAMISRRDSEANRAKVKEHGLTFPVGLQKQWEISRLYGMFATPIAYLIDEAGIVAHDVAVGVDSILELMSVAAATTHVNRFELTEGPKS